MKQRNWIVPALLALPFVVPVVYDVYRAVSAGEAEPANLLAVGGDGPIFVSSDLVLDLRSKPPGGGSGQRIIPEFVAGWAEATPQGRWTSGHSASLSWASATDRPRVLFLEGRLSRASGANPRLLVAVNGRSCGIVKITEKMAIHRVDMAAARVRIGNNTLELELVDEASPTEESDRTVLLRRVGFAADATGGFPRSSKRRSLVVDESERSIVVRRPGTIILPFDVAAGGSRLSVRYRFRNPQPDSDVRVTVGRRYVSPDRFDAVREWTLRADQGAAGRLRYTLRDRGERAALFVDVNSAAATHGFVLRDLTLDVVR